MHDASRGRSGRAWYFMRFERKTTRDSRFSAKKGERAEKEIESLRTLKIGYFDFPSFGS